MRKFFAFAAIAACFASCEKAEQLIVEEPENNTPEELVFHATMESNLTKTTLSDNGAGGYDILWATTDVIRITDRTRNALYKPATASTSSELTRQSGTEPTGPKYFAYYPSTIYDTSTQKVTLPTSLSLTSGTLSSFPMYAESNTTNLNFKNLLGVLHVTLTGSTADVMGKVVLSADQSLCGSVSSIVEDGGGYKAIVDGPKEMVITVSGSHTLSGGGYDLWIPLPAGTYTNFTITTFASGGASYSTKTAKSTIVVERSRITPVTLSTIAFDKALAGAGTVGDPYQITSESDIDILRKAILAGTSYSGKYFKVMNDITVTKAHVPFALTCNTFDGNNSTITLSAGYDISGKPTYAGFFSEFSGTLKDLTLAGSDVSFSMSETTSLQAFGALVGSWQTKSGTVSGCHNNINIALSSSSSAVLYVGGLLGIYWGTIQDCHNTGNVTVESTLRSYTAGVGGVVGRSGGIETSTNDGNVTVTNLRYTGGISGYVDNSGNGYYIDKCKNSGNVSATTLVGASSAYNRVRVGGIVGYDGYHTIRNCSNTGSITAWGPIVYWPGSIAGGIVAETGEVTIINCYNLGDITAKVGRALTDNGTYTCKPLAGGISGFNGTVTNCYNAGTLVTMRSSNSGSGWTYGRCEGGIVSMVDYKNSVYQGSASFCYFPVAKLDESSYDLYCIGYQTRAQTQDYYQDNNSTARGVSGTNCSSYAAGLVSSSAVTINAVEYPAGTSLLTLLNAERDVLGATYLPWKAGAGDPTYPVFDE